MIRLFLLQRTCAAVNRRARAPAISAKFAPLPKVEGALPFDPVAVAEVEQRMCAAVGRIMHVLPPFQRGSRRALSRRGLSLDPVAVAEVERAFVAKAAPALRALQ